MQIHVTKTFRRFQRKERIGDQALRLAIERADAGLIDADLGQGLIKQRVARPGQGERGLSNHHRLPFGASRRFSIWVCQERAVQHR